MLLYNYDYDYDYNYNHDLHPVAHTALSKGARGRQGVEPVSGGHVGGPLGEEESAVVALSSPDME